MRTCSQVLINDLVNSTEFLAAYGATETSAQELIAVANHFIGVHEENGDNHGRLVEAFQASVGLPEGQSWCLDFIQGCIAYVELKSGVTSRLPSTQSVRDLWTKTPLELRRPWPQIGDLILWQLGDTWQGHCGIITGINEKTYTTVEGNTRAGIGIIREGDGIYARTRQKGGTESFKELGFLHVFDY